MALALGRSGVNIVTLDVIEREDGIAVDDLCVEAPGGTSEALRHAAETVTSAVVEAIRPLDKEPGDLTAMALASSLAEASPGDSLERLVDGIPSALWASWCVALRAGAPPEVIAASPTAPSMSNVSTPWLPLDAPRRFRPSYWMPPAWRMGRMSYEVAAVPLPPADEALLIARRYGPRFRGAELRDLAHLTRIALAAHRTMVMP